MIPHNHTTLVPGCFRCELGRDEAFAAETERANDAEARVVLLQNTIARLYLDRGASESHLRRNIRKAFGESRDEDLDRRVE